MTVQLEQSAQDLLWTVADFLVRSGVERDTVAGALDDIAASIRTLKESPEWCGGVGDLLRRASEAYAHWWHASEYLDENGLPKGLREDGPAPSVRSLLGTRFSEYEIAKALQLLRKSPSISMDHSGIWHAHDAALLVPSDAALSIQRLAGVLRGLLSTFHSNNLAKVPSEGLFERTVLSSALPENYLPVVRRLAHQHLSQTALSLHRVIENAEKRPGKRADSEVGIQIFMYELPRRGRLPRPHREYSETEVDSAEGSG